MRDTNLLLPTLSVESLPFWTSRCIACRVVPRRRAASAWEIQSASNDASA